MSAETSRTGSILAICRVHQLVTTATGFGVTAIDKRAVEGPVRLRTFGVFRDVQADTEHHGGPDQAIYAYSQEDADFWSAQLGRAIPPGLFGENLRTQGVETTGAVIGTRWRIGKALLAHVTAAARAAGHTWLYLETGTAALHAPAVALYRSAGFENCDAFADYEPSPHNQFMRIAL